MGTQQLQVYVVTIVKCKKASHVSLFSLGSLQKAKDDVSD